MKKILYVAAAAMFLIAGCKGNGATQPAENAPAQAVGSSDIAFVQVEAVLAQSDLFQSEGAALQEKTKKAQEGWAKKERDLQSKAAQLQEKYQKGLLRPTRNPNRRRSSGRSPIISPLPRRRRRRSTRRTTSSRTGRRI